MRAPEHCPLPEVPPPDAPAVSLTPRERALQRIVASRQRWRAELIEPPEPEDGADAPPSLLPRRLRVLWRGWRRSLRHSALAPAASLLTAGLQGWWREQPWRPGAELLGQELHATLTPKLRRHPVAATVLAVGAGMLAWRLLRWPPVARRAHSVPGQAGRWLWRQLHLLLGQPPAQALFTSLLVMFSTQMAKKAADAAHSAAGAADVAAGAAAGAADAVDAAWQAGSPSDPVSPVRQDNPA